jgi:hypothetical protein
MLLPRVFLNRIDASIEDKIKLQNLLLSLPLSQGLSSESMKFPTSAAAPGESLFARRKQPTFASQAYDNVDELMNN